MLQLAALLGLALVAPPARFGGDMRVARAPHARPTAASRVSMAAITVDGVRIGPPPDLPSLLLHNRIVYVGTGLVPQVAELIVAQLLYMQARSPACRPRPPAAPKMARRERARAEAPAAHPHPPPSAPAAAAARSSTAAISTTTCTSTRRAPPRRTA